MLDVYIGIPQDRVSDLPRKTSMENNSTLQAVQLRKVKGSR